LATWFKRGSEEPRLNTFVDQVEVDFLGV